HSSLWFLSGESLSRRLVEQVDEPRIWFEPDLFARLELMPFAENRDQVLAARKARDHLDLGAGGLDHLDGGFHAVRRQQDMFGPDAVNCRPAVGGYGRCFDRQVQAARSFERDRAVPPD